MTLKAVPNYGPNEVQHRQVMADTMNQMMRGRANNTGTVTLAAGATSTDVIDNQFDSSMVPVLIPTTATAAAALATTYLSARDNGTFTLTHANTADIDRTFLYIRWG